MIVDTADAVRTIAEAGIAGMAALVMLSLIFGWIRPRSAVTEVRRDRDDRLAEAHLARDAWKAAHDEAETARREQEVLLTTAVTEIKEMVKAITRPTPGAVPGPMDGSPYA